LFSLAAGLVCAACGGGGHDRPKSESNFYGYTLEQLTQAVPLLRVEGGTLPVRSRGAQTSFFMPGTTITRFDPLTGQPTFERFTDGYSVPAWFVVVTALSAEGEEVATGWTARTIWAVRGDQMISSRDLKESEAKAFGAVFFNPPFPADGAWAVAEMVRGQEVQLVAALISWTLVDH
jgi:hypothetical protein